MSLVRASPERAPARQPTVMDRNEGRAMMRTRPLRQPARPHPAVAVAVLVLSLIAPAVRAQPPSVQLSFETPPADPNPPPLPSPMELPEPPRLPVALLAGAPAAAPANEGTLVIDDPAVIQAGCSACGDGGGVLGPHGGHGQIFPRCNCGSGPCIPGREACSPCCHDGVLGRLLCGLYECICCPDPCYEARWIPLADSALFCDSVRPITQMRFRWDSGVDLVLPDRAEYFWARADGMGKGPKPVAPFLAETRLKYNDFNMYTEAAAGKIGVFVEMPYRSVDPDNEPHAAGFGDMNLGTKTLVFDCELLQIAFQFRTYLPVGNFTKGIGNGHVSLEPSLIMGLRIAHDTYLQTQIAEWIPVGGDPTYAGAILHYHASLNHVLARILPDVPLIGTLEMSGYSFQDGAYTDPYLGPFQKAGDDTYVYLGSGIRLFVCDRIDFGFGMNFALTDRHFAGELYRTEFRMRF
jgi:hypothetical protein